MNDATPSRLPAQDLPDLQIGRGFDLLAGVRVIDLSSSIAGPTASMLLSDFGAEVIKIERPGTGDDARAWGPPFLHGQSLWFMSVNRNKKSVTLDPSSPEGLEALHGLMGKADVVLVNQLPRVTGKLRIDADTIRTIRPDIVYVSITGFGMDGERADWGCYDLIAEGYSGVMDVTGSPEGGPQKVGAPAADMLAGQDAAMATMAALFSRQATGRGRIVDVALVDSMTRFMSCRIVPYLGSGEVPIRSGGTDSVIAIYQAFDTADLPITLGLGNDGIWRRFWAAVGDPEFGARPDYADNARRRGRRPEIVERIQHHLSGAPREHWLEVLREARVPVGPINRVDEVAQDEELRRRGVLYNLADGDRSIPQVGTGIRFDGAANVPRAAPPGLGQHTDEILADLLGYDADKLEALRSAGTI
ncbi:CaiB/BaiF CoA transferase family protein [Lutibaculum baratangense]|uniref:CAIB/BAIF family protein n=1 Tax=Lutibaculum baratangense AMV1 TaxID=631454 RepID=V4REI4_9HYPH|nr:CoA transferase [Lutibaculum baratangense]ESR23799.1 CAIB/BAIF family protein [Lutibaculum baratangense AMV1]